MSYVGALLKYYPQFSLGFVWDELPMGEGYAYITVAMGMDAWLAFSGVTTEKGASYVEKETEQLKAVALKAWALR